MADVFLERDFDPPVTPADLMAACRGTLVHGDPEFERLFPEPSKGKEHP